MLNFFDKMINYFDKRPWMLFLGLSLFALALTGLLVSLSGPSKPVVRRTCAAGLGFAMDRDKHLTRVPEWDYLCLK